MIYSEVDRELFDPVKDSINGVVPFIANPISRLQNVFNFLPAQYILMGSVTSSGKTSLIDHFILSIVENKPKDMHFEALYYSMERKKKFKFAKFISWKLFMAEGKRIASSHLLNSDGKFTIGQMNYVKGNYKEWLEGVLDYIDIREGSRTVDQIKNDIDRLAMKIGLFYHSDDDHIYRFGEFVKAFDPKNVVQTKYGPKRFEKINLDGKEYTLYQNDKLYITPKPTIVFIVVDHIGKVRGRGTVKDVLDELDQVLAEARDNYNFSPIAISQFNRSVSNVDRLKYNSGDLDPVLEDFKNTGNLTESADIVLSIFDPARYKSWDSKGMYKGINIRDLTITPTGVQRARSFHVLKNSFGPDKQSIMLRFTGESMHFKAMPKRGDTSGLENMYKQIMQGE